MTAGKINAILINSIDDVVTVIKEVSAGDTAVFLKDGEIMQIPVTQTIPQYHKLAIRNIKKTEPLRKYGEIIGQAMEEIRQGCHVHEHNIASPGERGQIK